jgi:predicted ABC-type ATPase
MTTPNLYIIAGPNGSGKTTFAKVFLPSYTKCNRFINADLIAYGLSPFSPEEVAIKAARIVLDQIKTLSNEKVDFAFETTLSGKTYLKILKEIKNKGYKIHLFFLWLPSVELALARIKDRVSQGGHNVPAEDVKRRFSRGIYHLFYDYKTLVDVWRLFDNSTTDPKLIAKDEYGTLTVIDDGLYRQIRLK